MAIKNHLQFFPATPQHGPKVCVIAEIGVNHDGHVNRAIELVHAAKEAGADAIKLQLFDPKYLLSDHAVIADYQKKQGLTDAFDMLDQLKLNLDQMRAIREVAHKIGVGFVVTPFSLENFETLQALDVDAVKIASPDVVNLPLLEQTASLGKPMLVSTGTADLTEIAPAARIICDLPCCLLHCVSSYPAPAAQATLHAIGVLAGRYALPVGYSDHTSDPLTGALAVAGGACVIEKHFTYDCQATGPDHAASFEPDMFRAYVQQIRQAQILCGPRSKKVSDSEREVRQICRQSVCVTKNLPADHQLTAEDLTVRRPGTGIRAAQLHEVIGRHLTNPVQTGQLLTEAHLAAERKAAG